MWAKEYIGPLDLPQAPAVNMSKAHGQSFPALLVLVFIALIAIFTHNPVDYLPSGDGYLDSGCAVVRPLERRTELPCWNANSLFTTPQETYDLHMKGIEDYALRSHDSITAHEAALHMCSILESQLTPVQDLRVIVNIPLLNNLAFEAARWGLLLDMQWVYESGHSIECHSGRPTLLTTYQILLDRQNPTVLTECLEIANVLVNAPFGRWAEELIVENLAAAIIAEDRPMSIRDRHFCKEVFGYLSDTIDRMENQGLTETQQYQSLAALRAHLQRFFGETQA